MSEDFRPLGVGDLVKVLRAVRLPIEDPLGIGIIERITRSTVSGESLYWVRGFLAARTERELRRTKTLADLYAESPLDSHREHFGGVNAALAKAECADELEAHLARPSHGPAGGEMAHLASAMRKLLPKPLLDEVIGHLDPLGTFKKALQDAPPGIREGETTEKENLVEKDIRG